MPEPITPRVLVVVNNGSAEIFADPDVRFRLVDYDDNPKARIPKEFRAMPPEPVASLLSITLTGDVRPF